MKKNVFITGATSGFGKATAEKFASTGNNLIITGRRKELLDSFCNELKNKYSIDVTALQFDVQNKEQVQDAFNEFKTKYSCIDILINNAGLALGRDAFDEASMQDWETMMQTNVMGLLYVTNAALPFLKKSSQPQIINIGSTAGKEVYEKGNVYCASKYAVDALSQAMRIDLLPHEIKVTQICPGAAETEFSRVRFHGDEAKASAVYKGIQALRAQDVAEIIYYTTTLPPHVCINDLVVTCTQQANSFYFNRK